MHVHPFHHRSLWILSISLIASHSWNHRFATSTHPKQLHLFSSGFGAAIPVRVTAFSVVEGQLGRPLAIGTRYVRQEPCTSWGKETSCKKNYTSKKIFNTWNMLWSWCRKLLMEIFKTGGFCVAEVGSHIYIIYYAMLFTCHPCWYFVS